MKKLVELPNTNTVACIEYDFIPCDDSFDLRKHEFVPSTAWITGITFLQKEYGSTAFALSFEQFFAIGLAIADLKEKNVSLNTREYLAEQKNRY